MMLGLAIGDFLGNTSETLTPLPGRRDMDGSRIIFRTVMLLDSESVCPRMTLSGAAQLLTRDLSFDAFAVLHSGLRKTPIFAGERLSPEQLSDAQDEVRTNRFFADARLHAAEQATLEDYQRSGFARGSHGACRGHADGSGNGAIVLVSKHGPVSTGKQLECMGKIGGSGYRILVWKLKSAGSEPFFMADRTSVSNRRE